MSIRLPSSNEGGTAGPGRKGIKELFTFAHRMPRLLFPHIILFFLPVIMAVSQTSMSYEEYIEKYKDMAVSEMEKYHIPASITLAQGLLESGSGNSILAKEANNHFGIKCQKGWTGKTFTMDDDEKDECFRKYDSPEESYRDHSLFLTTRDRYAALFDLKITDYKGWAKGLKEAGYATNPRYAELLIKIIEENELYLYDNGIPPGKKHHKEQEDHPVTEQKESPARVEHKGPVRPAEAIPFGKWESGREMFLNNKVIFIYARQGDTWQGVAAEFGIYGWQVRKYNNLEMKEQPEPGSIIYLEHKRSKGTPEFHRVAEGESLDELSQAYAVKTSALVRLNGLKRGDEPEPGRVIRLR